jgi:hypothetical protein
MTTRKSPYRWHSRNYNRPFELGENMNIDIHHRWRKNGKINGENRKIYAPGVDRLFPTASPHALHNNILNPSLNPRK